MEKPLEQFGVKRSIFTRNHGLAHDYGQYLRIVKDSGGFISDKML